MTWNYRIIKKTEPEAGLEGAGYYIHEAHYNDSGEICGMTEQPSFLFGDTPEALMSDLEKKLKDAKSQSVLDADKIKFARMND